MKGCGGLRLRLIHPTSCHCLKQCSRCHLRKCGCGRSDIRRGESARPDLLIIERILSGSFVWREISISRSSAKLIRPRSNIQCAVPERAIPLLTISGPLASTGRICAAATSARPFPLMSFRPVIAQRSSYARNRNRTESRRTPPVPHRAQLASRWCRRRASTTCRFSFDVRSSSACKRSASIRSARTKSFAAIRARATLKVARCRAWASAFVMTSTLLSRRLFVPITGVTPHNPTACINGLAYLPAGCGVERRTFLKR